MAEHHHPLSVTALTDRSHLSMALGLVPSHPTNHLTAVCLESCSSWARQCQVSLHPCSVQAYDLVSAFKAFLAGSSYGPLSAPSLSRELVTHPHFMIHRTYSKKADNNPTIIYLPKKSLWMFPYIFFNPLRQGLTV